jgi:two-component system, chemotaxis family, chemotaxis protein CheY
MRILIVDDDYICRTQFKALLSKHGDCDCAPLGRIALDLFEIAHRDHVPYGLITLDINMPEMDGHAVIARMREIEESLRAKQSDLEGVKVIMISARTERKDILASFREGCEGYLRKPITPAALLQVLEELHLV